MYSETLPDWIWAIYYLFLFVTLGTAIICVIRNRMRGLSIVAVIFTLTVPVVSFFFSIGRAAGTNEYEHLVSQLQQGAIWSIYAVIGYLFILVWWIVYLFKSKN